MSKNGTGILLSHLPGVYHSSDDLRQLLSPLEAVLFGPEDEAARLRRFSGLEQEIARIFKYFDAKETPDEFLPWLEEWVALSYTRALSRERRRALLAEIVPLYARRGTKSYLARLLEYFTPDRAEITIDDSEFFGLTIGKSSVGLDSWLEHDRAFYFKVKVRAPYPASITDQQRTQLRQQWKDHACKVIDLAKPAHTAYELDWAFAEPQEL